MNRFYTLILFFLLFSTGVLKAQEASSFVKGKSERFDPRSDQNNFMPNEVLVKFKDEVKLKSGSLKSSSINGLVEVLSKHGLTVGEEMFPGARKLKSGQRFVITPTGEKMELPSMKNVFRLSLSKTKSAKTEPLNIHQAIEELKALSEVEYVEPNYIFSIGDFKPAGPEMSQEEIEASPANDELSTESSGLIPNDPLYNSQWGIPACNIDNVWAEHPGDGSSIIAILDTGVDWEHADLTDNIWVNEDELNGAEGYDDDGNGYIDDIRGWDFINHDNDPKDDNSHGTHCAGIAAAVGNNELGIAGANWNAKIMPIKVFQSSGRADAATIAKGISYAAANGAHVLSMSFGSYAESITMRNALANAYATAVLVAAAGNDGLCIGPQRCPDKRFGKPEYPGAFSFVLGVEANSQTAKAGFSNFDQDGPVFSRYDDLWNYELKAPGTGILSTVPGGNYRSYSGTSMATPLVAAAVSLYREQKTTDNQEIMWGNLINTSGNNVNLDAAINIDPEPVLNIVKYQLSDTLTDGDRDWKADAGETIQLEVSVRNSWGAADSVYVGIEFDEFEDPSVAEIEKDTALLGGIGPYATLSNFKKLLQVKINPDVAHDRDIRFLLKTWKGKQKEYLHERKITLRVEHGTELKGVLEDTLRLSADKFWLVSNSFKIGATGVLIIEPGANLKIERKISSYGKIIGKGMPKKQIKIFGPLGIWGGNVEFEYVQFSGFRGQEYDMDEAFYEISGTISNCVFEDFVCDSRPFWRCYVNFKDCVFKDFTTWSGRWCAVVETYGNFENCNFINIKGSKWEDALRYNGIANCNLQGFKNLRCGVENREMENCNILSDFTAIESKPGISIAIANTYWGTNDSEIIDRKIKDFWDDSELSLVKYDPKLEQPSSMAHACVWKVLVNGKDAQDEFKLMDPIGVGRQKFEVYFNRPMDISFTPSVSMGVREPYNQSFIDEDAVWSADSLIYTVYKTIGLTESDGIHRIKLVEGKDMEGFDLVPEYDRFNVNIQTAGSLSNGFAASPGMGKIDLTWDAPDEYVDDLLGYNMYRYKYINDKITSDSVLINPQLLTEPDYTDFEVQPATKYFYSYKTVRTNFTESDYSKVVAATPLTAAKGDANGDLSVNVVDVTTTVSQILQKQPKPFIFDAADINGDKNINVLDITGIINLVLHPATKSSPSSSRAMLAEFYIRQDTLFANSPVPLGGVQFILHDTEKGAYQVLPALKDMERAELLQGDSLLLLAYSMSGKTIATGEVPLLKLGNLESYVDGLVLASSNGDKVEGIVSKSKPVFDDLDDKEQVAKLINNFPNPVTDITTIQVEIKAPVEKVEIEIIDIQGRIVDVLKDYNLSSGLYQFVWNPGSHKGIFIAVLKVVKDGETFKGQNIRMLVE
ncbi:S8 family serine peptidase [Ancylomarina sp. YFZ004]